MELQALLASFEGAARAGTVDEAAAAFYGASVILALQQLHSHKLAYRNLAPEALFLDEEGYLQLMDFKYAAIDDGSASLQSYVGLEQYLSPEQVRGSGHGLAVDFWALGVLLYEIVVGRPPWGTPSAAVAPSVQEAGPLAQVGAETAVYEQILKHARGDIGRHHELAASAEFVSLVDALLDPDPASRLGAQSGDTMKLCSHPWFASIDINRLEQGVLQAPHRGLCQARVSTRGPVQDRASLLDEALTDDDTRWCAVFDDEEAVPQSSSPKMLRIANEPSKPSLSSQGLVMPTSSRSFSLNNGVKSSRRFSAASKAFNMLFWGGQSSTRGDAIDSDRSDMQGARQRRTFYQPARDFPEDDE